MPVLPVLLCEDTGMTHPTAYLALAATGQLIKKIDVAFDTSTLLYGTYAKDADYMAAVAELSRL
jgi:hypothetical protein